MSSLTTPAPSRRGGRSTFKVVLLGEGRVGKTSLVLRYVSNLFSDKQTATIQASFMARNITVRGEPVTLAIWDTAGQERFHALGPIYYRDADAALLVYDMMDKDSFERVKSWVKELKKMADPNIVITIAANKSDMDKHRQVDLQTAEGYATSIGASHFITSAKLNTGIEEAFSDVAQRILEKRGREAASATSSSLPSSGQRRSVVIVDSAPKPPTQSQCCG